MLRHLLVLTSPPTGPIPSRFATPLGPPENWDGDAWVLPSGRVVSGREVRSRASRRSLGTEAARTRPAMITIRERKPAR